jgi:cytochrome c-type biogenesis protein CcmH
MIGFWILAALVSALAGLLILLRAARAQTPTAIDPARAVYARQLREIEEDAGRGLLTDAEHKAARAEAGRRLIRAAEAAEPAPESRAGRRLALAAAIAAPLLALAVYLMTGSPRTPDEPFARRLEGWRRADLQSLDLPRIAAILEQAAREHPKDPQPLLFLARAQQAQGQAVLAVHTLEQAVRTSPGRADAWAALGDALTEQADGEVTPGARRAFEQALKLDPRTPLARYALARADIAAGRAPQGLAVWRALMGELPSGDPRRAALQQEIAAVERTGRLPAPAAAAPAAGQDQGEQRAFIQSMVDRLAARLKAQPEDPDGWARLIRAYGVLGETDRQKAAIAEVERRYASRPAQMRSILQQR